MNKEAYQDGYMSTWDKPEPTPPYSYKAVKRYIMDKRDYSPDYLKGELAEFHDAYDQDNKKDIEEELQDVMYGIQMLAASKLKKDIPILGADDKIKVFIDRIKAFNEMFREHGVKFHVDYLSGGSNFKKPVKIQQAFKLAGKDISAEEAQLLSEKYMKLYRA